MGNGTWTAQPQARQRDEDAGTKSIDLAILASPSKLEENLSRNVPTPNSGKVPGKSLIQAVYRAAGQDSVLALKWKTDTKMKCSQDYLKNL